MSIVKEIVGTGIGHVGAAMWKLDTYREFGTTKEADYYNSDKLSLFGKIGRNLVMTSGAMIFGSREAFENACNER